MHDLNQIAKMNEQAHAHSIQTAREAGRWVVAKYTGLHLHSTSEHGDPAEAHAAYAALVSDASPDVRVVVLGPLAPEQVIGRRDQSEDRVAG